MDEFIAQFPEEIRERLERVRWAIRKQAPKAEEAISYGMAAFKWNGNLIFFSAFKDHIGIYPRPKSLEKELAKYDGGKGTVQFPHSRPIPIALIRKIVKLRMEENLTKAEAKKKKKSA